MKSLSFFELKSFALWFQSETEAAQLQDIWTNGQTLVLHFYKNKDLFLCMDLSVQEPMIALLFKKPPVEKKQKPTVLFLNAHAKNLRLSKAWVQPEAGRILYLALENGDRNCEIELRLIPKSVNVLVRAGEKKISWEKPKDLPTSHSAQVGETNEINWIQFGENWFVEKFKTKAGKVNSSSVDPRIKVLEKKKKALGEIAIKLQQDSAKDWQQLGEALKISDQVPEALQNIYDLKKSRSWNLENAFRQSKLLKKKKEGTLQRVEILKNEVAALEKDLSQNPELRLKAKVEAGGRKILEKSQSKGRRLVLETGVEAIIGKSAKDNLLILRHAQAWDLWLHLKDFPGAHAIIVRPRNKEIGREVIQKVAHWLIKESLSHEEVRFGGKYEVVVVETRHVRPIKGDQLGRVTYHHAQTYSFASKP